MASGLGKIAEEENKIGSERNADQDTRKRSARLSLTKKKVGKGGKSCARRCGLTPAAGFNIAEPPGIRIRHGCEWKKSNISQAERAGDATKNSPQWGKGTW